MLVMSNKIVFCDHIGRVISGVLVHQDEATLVVENPVIVAVQLDNNNVHVQPIPYVFTNLLAPGSKNEWTFSKSNIVISTVELEPRLAANIESIGANRPKAAPQPEGKVINLFD